MSEMQARSLPTNCRFSEGNGNGRKSPVNQKPFLIGVAGGTASGKTTVCRKILESLTSEGEKTPGDLVIISQDSFYLPLTPEQLANVKDFNFDHPDAFDYDLMNAVISDLKNGLPVDIPVYDFTTHKRSEEFTRVYPSEVILVEALLLPVELTHQQRELREQFDIKIFVDTDADIRLARRIRRDITERGRDIDGVLKQYERFVKPSFDEYTGPSRKFADVIIPRGGDNIVGINLISEHVQQRLHLMKKESTNPKPPNYFEINTPPRQCIKGFDL